MQKLVIVIHVGLECATIRSCCIRMVQNFETLNWFGPEKTNLMTVMGFTWSFRKVLDLLGGATFSGQPACKKQCFAKPAVVPLPATQPYPLRERETTSQPPLP